MVFLTISGVETTLQAGSYPAIEALTRQSPEEWTPLFDPCQRNISHDDGTGTFNQLRITVRGRQTAPAAIRLRVNGVPARPCQGSPCLAGGTCTPHCYAAQCHCPACHSGSRFVHSLSLRLGPEIWCRNSRRMRAEQRN